uniref:SAGA-associated factor 11 n=1 Tax=Steinernema glaseri TaxID=37863 RepID=A0A1I8AD90_9BILA
MEVTPPKRVVIPSVDGTFNLQRINRDALESSRQANIAKCKKCGTQSDLSAALEHKNICPGYRRVLFVKKAAL